MCLLVIGDPHFKLDNAEFTDILGIETLSLIKTGEYSAVIVLGDILDKHERVHIAVLDRVVGFLRTIAEHTPVYCLVGNHDRSKDSDFLDDLHALKVLEDFKIPQIHMINKPMKTQIEGRNIVLVPYVPKNRFFEALGFVDNWRDADLIFAHQEIRGAHLGVVSSDIEEAWSEDLPLVISGHIHGYQKINKKWIYPGTPYPQNFGESNNRALLKIDLSGSKVQIKRLRIDTPKLLTFDFVGNDLLSNNGELLWIPDSDRNKYKLKISGDNITFRSIKKLMQRDPVYRYVTLQYSGAAPGDVPSGDEITTPEQRIPTFEEFLRSKLTPELLDIWNELI